MTNASGKTRLAPRLNRRSFIGSTAAIGGTTALMIPKASAATTKLQGYTNMPSVQAGGTIDFFLSDPVAGATPTSVSFTISRVGQPDSYVTSTTLNVVNQGIRATASTAGCGWARNYQLVTANTWPSGLYYAYLQSGDGTNAYTVPFVVRAVGRTAGVKTIVNIPMLTVHAYNAFGGKSIYDFNSSGGVRASQVSLDRPFTDAFTFFDVWSQYLVRWMAKNGLAADFCTDWDIETNPSILNGYQLYVQAGHDEYWSSGRRDTMDAFVAAGGNCAYLGGNTAWFQSRLEGTDKRTLVSYKDAATDPVTTPALKTINWINLAPPRPENQTTGLGFLLGCSWASATLPRPRTPYIVQRPEHWAFAGTGLGQGAPGFGDAFVGYECDAAAFALGSDTRPYPTGLDGTPPTLRILSQADGSTWDAQARLLGGSEVSGYAHIAVFSRGGGAGTVFNVGSTDWAYGLRPELDGGTPNPISRITLNVFNKLVQPYSESADVRLFRNVVGNTNNNYYGIGTSAPSGSGKTLDGWVFRAFAAPVTGSVPVYRYRIVNADPTRTTYFLRASATAPSGTTLDGLAFHAFPAYRSDATPVYEHYALNSTLNAFVALYSTTAAPPAGWSAGPIVFYVPTDSGIATPPPPTPGFTLSAAASTLAVVQGRSATDAITVAPVNGFAGTVAFVASGLPAGVTASFVATSTGSTLTVNVGAAAVPGSYPLTITGSAPNTTGPSSIVVTLTVTAAAVPSFTLAAAAATLSLMQGRSATDAITVTAVNGFAGTVAFTTSALPAGVTASFAANSGGSTLTLNVGATAAPGSYPVTVTGTAPNTSGPASVGLTLTITAAPAQSFTLSSSTGEIDLPLLGLFGGSATIGVDGVNGFGSAVSFSVGGVPNGLFASLSPASSASGTRLTITKALYPIVLPGNYTVTITGTSGTLRASTSVVLEVRLLF